MDMNNEKRINEVLNSLDKIQRAEASPFLYDRILYKINAEGSEYTPARLVWLAAASFALLLILNITILKKAKNSSAAQSESQTLASGYNLMNENTISYN
jgi:hypothetical protein